ncbi:tail assembly chaperone [Enterococcus sp. LJL51]|uniref:tail assembly chaperone n=1 Tax=Enterococcus sp. LJL51 TaxID=3416656 RepID=UPI003CF88661
MELSLNEKTAEFRFGYGFLKEINKRYSIERNGMQLKLGVGAVLSNLLLSDVDTLFEVLLIANMTENPRITVKELEEYVEVNGVQKLFEDVLEELKKSEFTGIMTRKMIEEAQE